MVLVWLTIKTFLNKWPILKGWRLTRTKEDCLCTLPILIKLLDNNLLTTAIWYPINNNYHQMLSAVPILITIFWAVLKRNHNSSNRLISISIEPIRSPMVFKVWEETQSQYLREIHNKLWTKGSIQQAFSQISHLVESNQRKGELNVKSGKD